MTTSTVPTSDALPFATDLSTGLEQRYDPSAFPNLVVVGGSGFGKTNVLDVLSVSAHKSSAQTYMIRAEATDVESLDGFADGLEIAETLMRTLHDELRNRELRMAVAGGPEAQGSHKVEPRIFIIVDNLRSLPLLDVAPDGTDEEERAAEYLKYLLAALTLFAVEGPAQRIHVIFAAPNITDVPAEILTGAATLDLDARGAADQGTAAFAVGRGIFVTGDDVARVDLWAAAGAL
jgi:hypothetical protein